ncbi:MAG: hypothetical protein B7Z14_07695 [Bosea sp. 32-68-6]|nr:MAG: hypothetical protein B7Z14_07695 [Bosea sp. 32-68-6]
MKDALQLSLATGFNAEDGTVDLEAIGKQLLLSKADLGHLAGLSSDTIKKRDRLAAPAPQKRLNEMMQILLRVQPWAGSGAQALAWYRAQGIPSFGDMTAAQLVKQGRANDVLDYLDRIAECGFA